MDARINKKPIMLLDNVSSQPVSGAPSITRDSLINIYLVGDAGIGKSSLIIRYISDTYSESQNTIGFSYKEKDIKIHNKLVRTFIWDSGDQERINRGNIKRNPNVIIATFDLTDINSINNIQQWLLGNGVALTRNGIDILLVGTKSDDIHHRMTNVTDVSKLLKNCSFIKAYVETSAKSNINVTNLFTIAATTFLERHMQDNPASQLEDQDSMDFRNKIKKELKKYIDDIDSHKLANTKKTNFSHSFWINKVKQGLNKEANYYLAGCLLEKLEKSSESIDSIFDDIPRQRLTIITQRGLNMDREYEDLGINDELQKIITSVNVAGRYQSKKN